MRCEALHCGGDAVIKLIEQGVALTGRNTTGPPCSVGRQIPTRPAADAPTGPTAGSVTDDDRRRQTTDDCQQNNTGPLGGPVIRWEYSPRCAARHRDATQRNTSGVTEPLAGFVVVFFFRLLRKRSFGDESHWCLQAGHSSCDSYQQLHYCQ